MSFLRNKHLLAALISAPILGLLSYFLVDSILKEKPQPAMTGKAYPLVAKSNCRYTSGECDLVNTSFKSKLTIRQSDDEQVLFLQSNHALDGVKIGFVSEAEERSYAEPQSMLAQDPSATQWAIPLPLPANEDTRLMVVMLAGGAQYYAETTMGFSEYKAAYKRDFRTTSDNPTR